MKNCTLLAFLLLFALGAKATPDNPPRVDGGTAFEVFADYYPEAGYEHSPYVKVYWGMSLYDFEMGSLPDDWTNDNDYPWMVTTPPVQGYHGEYCLMSGNSGVGSSTSTIETTVTFVEDGSVSFLGGCYGEGSAYTSIYDACEFYIDDEQMFRHGSLQSWDVYSYDVTAGTHTFKWSYTKDYYDNSPGDAFFVDDVIFSGTSSMGAPGAGYDVYRQSCDVETGTFGTASKIASNVTEKQYIDEEWENLAPGQYRFGALDPNVAGADIVWSDMLVKSTVDYFEITVEVNDSSLGTVSGGGTFTYGETCTLVATPNLGSVFNNWDDDDGNSIYEKTYTFTVKGDATYTAQFDLMALYPWFESQPEEGGSADYTDGDGDGVVYYGESMTFTVTPNQGYAFIELGIPVGDHYEVLSTEPVFTTVFDSVFITTYGDPEYGMEEETPFVIIFAQADGDCIQPQNFAADEVGPTSATLSWKEYGASQAWSIYYRPTQTPTFVPYDSIEVFQNPYTLSYLQPNTTYEAYVVPSCGVDQYGANEWVSSYTTEFTTLDACPVPQKVTVDDITASTATVTWKDYSESYRVSMGLANVILDETFENGIPDSMGCDTTRYAWTLVDGHLQSSNAGVPYSSSSIAYTATYLNNGIVAFDALCHGEGEEWAFDACIFYIDGQQVLYVGAGDTGWHRYSFDVPSGTHTFAWEYYKDSDYNSPDDCFAIDNVLMAATTPSNEAPIAVEDAEYTITGLTPNTVYFVQVQAVCDQQQTDWSSPVFFTTLQGQQYTITATANPELGGAIVGAGSYVEDDDCTLTAFANEGYTFTNWTEDGAVVDTNRVFTFTVISDRTLVANFTLNSYEITVTADPEAGGTVTGANTYDHGATCTLTATPNQGYQFVGWFCDNDIVTEDATYSFEVGGPATYVAVFQLIQYYPQLTWQPEGYGYAWVDSDNAQIIQYGEEVTLKAMPSYGYHLDKWVTMDEDGNPTIELSTDTVFTFTMDADNILTSLYPDGGTVEFIAFFELNTYEITASANPNEGGTISGEGLVDGVGTFDHGSECTLTATAADGYSFLNWTEDGTEVSTDVAYTILVEEAHVLVANFELKSYGITATANPTEGGTVEGAGTYNHFDECTLTAIPQEGYHFVNWTDEGQQVVSTDAEYTFVVDGRRILTANFELNSYEITATADPAEGGTVSGEGLVDGVGTFTHGTECTLTATPSDDYLFEGWMENGEIVSTDAEYTFTVTGEHTLVASFTLGTFDITVKASPANGGTVSGAGSYEAGASCTLKANPATGYTFARWMKNGTQVSTDAYYTFEVTEAGTYIAQFTKKNFIIAATANPEEGGTISGTGTYAYQSTVTLTATPNEGYSFVNWTENGEAVSTDAIYTFPASADRTLVAHFEWSTYEIEVSANPAEGGNVTGEGLVDGVGTFDHGATCTLVVTPNDGYSFVNWTEDGVEVSREMEYTFTVEAAHTLVANFELDVYAVMVEADPAEGGTIEGEGFVEGEGDFEYGSSCTVTAIANEGYTFVNWTNFGDEVATTATYTFTVEAPAALVAHFELNSYAITAEASPIEGGTVDGAGTYNHFEECTLTAAPADGYTFLNWTENGTAVSTDLVYTFMVEGERTLVANFELNSYTILVEAHPEEGGLVAGGDTYNHFEECTVTATPLVGYHFVNWTEGETEVSTDAEYTFTVTGERLLFANFELNSYEIAAEANPAEGGTVDGAGTYNHFEACTLTAVPAEGYTFLNWTENGTEVSTDLAYTFEVEGARTLVAHFELGSYEITATANPAVGGTIDGGGIYNHFEECTLTATPADGYSFVNWTEDGVEVTSMPEYTFMVEGARTLVANFELDIYAVMVEADPAEGGTIEGEGFVEGEGDFEYGASCTVTATANEGYTFVNWTNFGEEVATTATYTFTVLAPAALVAHFELNSYEITAEANPAAGGTITGAGTYNHGASCTLTATAAEGYTFVNWTKNGTQVATTPSFTLTVTEAGAYVANFTLNSYAITATANPTNGGTVAGAGTYNHGASCTLTATANAGYTFVNWTKNGTQVSTDASYTFNVTEAAAYVAHFTLNSYEITVMANASNGGTVTGSGTYNYGASCQVTATANAGYTFENWTENGTVVSTNANYTFTVTGERTLVANFVLQTYVINATADPANGGTIEGAGTYNHFFNCTLTATPAAGYIFENWTENGTVVSTNASYSFQVTANRTLVAHFSVASYQITAEADPAETGDITGTGTFHYGETCTLTVDPHENYTFINWTLNGQVVSEEASYTFVVTGTGHYVAHLQNTEGIDETSGLTVSLFPNPASEKVTVEASEPIKMYEVYTINGTLVSKQRCGSDRIEFNVEDYAAGTYVIRLVTDNKVEIRRFVKE